MADLLALVLRVLPEKIRERLTAERDCPGKSKEAAGTSDSAREDPGSGHARWSAGNDRLVAARGRRTRGEPGGRR